MRFPEKRHVLEGLIASLSATLDQLTRAAEQTRKDAIHEEAKPENDKDTRALEQSYLARGQAMRAESLLEQIAQLRALSLPALGPDDAIRAGALIAIEDDQGTRYLFMAPYGGGIAIGAEGVSVTVVTPVSALGRALLGRHAGDEVELRNRNEVRVYSVIAVA